MPCHSALSSALLAASVTTSSYSTPAASRAAVALVATRSELTTHDREALVVHGGDEAEALPELRPRTALVVLAARQVGAGLNGREAAAREIGTDVVDQTLRVPVIPCLRRGSDARNHRRQRRVRQLRVQLAQTARPWVGRQRAELAIGDGNVVGQQRLGVRPKHAAAAIEQCELARNSCCQRPFADSRWCEWVVERSRKEVVVGEGAGQTGASGEGERVCQFRVGRGCKRVVGQGWPCGWPGRGRRRQQFRPVRLRPSVSVLPVVARPMVEARVSARRDEPEGLVVADLDDPDTGHQAGPAGRSSPRAPERMSATAVSMSAPGSRSASRCPTALRSRSCAALTPAPGAGASARRKSSPWPAHSNSSASTCSTLPRTARAWRAPIGPIETWSSWSALVGIESTDAGWASVLFSDTRAAAAYW